jgi:hypothetical protein
VWFGVVRVMKSKKLQLARHVSQMGKTRKTCRVFDGKSSCLKDQEVDVRMA